MKYDIQYDTPDHGTINALSISGSRLCVIDGYLMFDMQFRVLRMDEANEQAIWSTRIDKLTA